MRVSTLYCAGKYGIVLLAWILFAMGSAIGGAVVFCTLAHYLYAAREPEAAAGNERERTRNEKKPQ